MPRKIVRTNIYHYQSIMIIYRQREVTIGAIVQIQVAIFYDVFPVLSGRGRVRWLMHNADFITRVQVKLNRVASPGHAKYKGDAMSAGIFAKKRMAILAQYPVLLEHIYVRRILRPPVPNLHFGVTPFPW